MKAKKIRLFHYTKADNLDKILSSGLIRLTATTNTNDPFEASIRHPYPEDEISDYLRRNCSPEVWNSDMQQSPSLVVCLSAKMSSPSMWGHYADSHKGVCLVFDVPAFFIEHQAERDVFNPALDRPIFPMEYCDDKPIPENHKDGDDEYNYKRIIRDSISRKGKEWEFEDEVRIPVATDLFTATKHTDIEWIDGWPYYNGLLGHLVGVILGIRSSLNAVWVESRLNSLHYNNVKVIKAQPSQTSYYVEARHSDETVFEDSSIDVLEIRRMYVESPNATKYDQLWFMKPAPSPARRGVG